MGASVLFLTYVLLAPPVPAAPPATMADVAFMAGHWRDPAAQGLSEEIWTAPEGDSMLGMWRFVTEGKAWIYELLSIRQEAASLVLLLRHFDPQLKAREEKDAPLVLPLVRKSEGEAVFEGRSSKGGLLRLTYRKQGADGLEGILEKDGAKPEVFRLQRFGAAR
jgi:uncharacterized protein DUF6265